MFSKFFERVPGQVIARKKGTFWGLKKGGTKNPCLQRLLLKSIDIDVEVLRAGPLDALKHTTQKIVQILANRWDAVMVGGTKIVIDSCRPWA